MPRIDRMVFLVALLAGVSLTAQRTWIVDRLNRPGADFTDIQPAVDAAAPGDVIQLRYVDWATTGLWYEAPMIQGKGLVIAGDPGSRPPVMGAFRVSGLPASQCVLLANMANGDQHYDNSGRSLPYRGVVGTDCLGPIHLDNMHIGAPPPTLASINGNSTTLSLNRCSIVTVANSELWQCRWYNCVVVTDSRLVIGNSMVGGGPAGQFMQWGATIAVGIGSELWLVDSTVVGSDGWYYPPLGLYTLAGAAIGVCSATLHVSAGCQIYGGWDVLGGSFAIRSGTDNTYCLPSLPNTIAEVNPQTANNGYLGSNLTVISRYVPGMTWALQRATQTLTLRQYTAPNSLTAYVAGSLQPAGVALPFGTAFLDPTALLVLALRAGNAAGQHDLVLPVTPLPAVGTTIGVQGISLQPTGELRLTNVTAPGVYW